MTDILLDQTTNDLDYTGGALSVVDDIEEVEQALGIAYRTGLGEWPYDTDAGVAYKGTMRAKGVPDSVVVAEIRRVGQAQRRVTEVREVELTRNNITRELTVDASVATIFGDTSVSTT